MTTWAYDNRLIGYEPSACRQSFSGSDDFSTFDHNLRKQPEDWLYRTFQVDYIRNRSGHRSKNHYELDKDYFLFVGCSHTEGIGVAVEHTFASVVSRHFGVDHYNMGMGGMGPDVVYYNLYHFLKNGFPKPKFVFIQWPEPVRYAHTVEGDDDRILNHLESGIRNKYIIGKGMWSLNDKELIEREDVAKKEFPDILYKVRNLLDDHKCKYVDYQQFQGLRFGAKYGVKLMLNERVEMIDHGRDMLHLGIKTHKNFAQILINKIERDKLL